MTKRGFTIVELLIVIAIIAVLVALLMPALGGVFRQAVGTSCLANLHQYGIAIKGYIADNKGLFPAGRPEANIQMDVGNGMKTRPRVTALLHPWMGPAFAEPDPANQRQDVTNPAYLCPTVGWADERNFSYGYNYQFLGNLRSKASTGEPANYPVNLASVEQPSRTVVMADCMGTAAAFPTEQRKKYDAKGNDYQALGNHAWTLDPPGLPDSNSFTADPNVDGNRSAIDPRHNGKANVLFADGHAESLTPQELGYEIAEDGTYLNTGDNSLWSGLGRHVLPPTAE